MFNKASQALDGVIGGVARAAVSFEEFPAQQAAPVEPAGTALNGKQRAGMLHVQHVADVCPCRLGAGRVCSRVLAATQLAGEQ